MKIIHCADLHIDSKMETNFTKEQSRERKEEVLRTFEKMVTYAADNNVEIIIIAGDMFDKKDVGKRAKNRVMEQIISNPEIEFLYLRGNHDNVDILEGMDKKPENLKLFTNEGWTKYRYGDVVIAGIEFDKENAQTIYDRLILDKSGINIVTLHGQESIYKNDKAEIVNLSELRNRYIDYLALGHIHQYKRERLDDRGVWCYSGCLEGRGFDECGEKGFVLLDISDGKVKDTFIPFSTRRFHEIDIDVSGIEGAFATNEIIMKIKEASSMIPSGDLVKFVLVGEVDIDTDIDITRIMYEMDSTHYFVKVNNKIKVKIDYRQYENARSLKGELVRLLQEQEMEEEIKAKIIEIGLKALRGEEIEL